MPRSSHSGRIAAPLLCVLLLVTAAILSVGAANDAPTWKAGTAVTNITPSDWLWMGGYGARSRPAEGKEMDLRLKVLALQDSRGKRGVIVTSDLLGFPQTIYSNVCTTLERTYKLQPAEVILSASHTHCGPVLRESAMDAYGLSVSERSKVEKYSTWLEQSLVSTVGAALSNMAPARLASGQGNASFAVNRRNNLEKDVPKLLASGELRGPVDHSIPVLAVYHTNGELKAAFFGYACHNTVMDYYKWSGDYAGFAQMEIENRHKNALAMFFMGCGGDQNPLPRRQLALAQQYGGLLASAVEEVLASSPQRLEPELDTRMQIINLNLGEAPGKEELLRLANNANGTPTLTRWASRLLAQLKTGTPLTRTYPYPIQAWRIGREQLLITLGGEPVVDYSLEFKRLFGARTWVAGYCNDVMGYIPSTRVLTEDAGPHKPGWGYEGSRSMMPYGLPAFRWNEGVQEQITTAVRQLATQASSPPPPSALRLNTLTR